MISMTPTDPIASQPPLPAKRLHILIVHQSFATLGEAGGTRHHELARYLVERGHTVTIITSRISYLTGKAQTAAPHPAGSVEKDGEHITILRTYTYNAIHRSFIHRVLAFFSFMVSSFIAGMGVRSVDVVWGTSPPIFQGVTAWLLARLKGVPFLFEVRDLWPAFAIQVGVLKQPLLIHASQFLERFLYRHADRVMVNSPGYLQHVKERGARRVELIPNGADPAMFDPDCRGDAFRQKAGLGDAFVVLYAGAHGLSNDLGVVLQAAEILQPQAQIRLVMLGDGKEKPALQNWARDHGLKNVVFLPPVPKNEMRDALAAADACLAILKPIPLYATTYPNKVFDYMAAGRPVILAIDGVIREVVESSGAGIAVRPGDPAELARAIQTLATLPDRGRSLGLAGRKSIVTDYSRAGAAQRLAHVLEEMGREHGR
jgi:glycosyltransferase involved in cell wall biosynthesis